MQWFSYLDAREVLQQEYSQPPMLPSPHFWWVVKANTPFPFPAPMGTSTCPWLLQALPGQQIKLTLFDFTLKDATGRLRQAGTSNDEVTCAASLAVREGSGPTTRTGLCDGSAREKDVYRTRTSAAQVWLTFEDLQETPYFLLSFEGDYNNSHILFHSCYSFAGSFVHQFMCLFIFCD